MIDSTTSKRNGRDESSESRRMATSQVKPQQQASRPAGQQASRPAERAARAHGRARAALAIVRRTHREPRQRTHYWTICIGQLVDRVAERSAIAKCLRSGVPLVSVCLVPEFCKIRRPSTWWSLERGEAVID